MFYEKYSIPLNVVENNNLLSPSLKKLTYKLTMKFVSEAYCGGVRGELYKSKDLISARSSFMFLIMSLHVLFSDLLSVCSRPHKDLSRKRNTQFEIMGMTWF